MLPFDKPFFSILVPSYNRPHELKRCVDSILRSSFDSFEIVVSDDFSPLREEIEDVMSCYSDNSKVTFYQQKFNLKEPGNKNFLATKANGEFNIVVGDDDIVATNTLKLIHHFIAENPSFDIYGMGYYIVDEHNKPISVHCSTKATILSNEDNARYLFEFGVSPMAFMHPATFCCRSGIELRLPYRSDVGIGEDSCFLLQAVARGYSLITIPTPLFNWRKVQDKSTVVQGNQSAEHLSSFRAKSKIYNVLKYETFSNTWLKDYILSSTFRFKFLYTEVIKDPLAVTFSEAELGIESEMYSELVNYSDSMAARLRVRATRLIYLFDLCKILGVLSASKLVLTSILFRIKSAL